MTDRYKPTRMWSRAMAGERDKDHSDDLWRMYFHRGDTGRGGWRRAMLTKEDLEMNREFYEPGNGTRYDLIWGYVPGYNNKGHVLMVSWMRGGGSGGVSMVIGEGSFAHETYVSEKMGLGQADAEALAAFINEKLEIK